MAKDPMKTSLDLLGEEAPEAALRCILVHGTWAPDAPWVQADSAMAKAARELENGDVALYKFVWSGKNDHNVRAKVSETLALNLQDHEKRFPHAKFLLIAHSHGGNVALRAVRDVAAPSRFQVVTMATPFFHIEERPALTLRALVVIGAAALATFLLAFVGLVAYPFEYMYSYFFPYLYSLKWELVSRIVSEPYRKPLGILLMCVGYGSLFMVVYFLTPIEQYFWPARSAANWLRMRPGRVRTLCLWHIPDEPFWGLRSLRLIGEVVPRVLHQVSKVLYVAAIIAAIVWAGISAYDRVLPSTLFELKYSLWTAFLSSIALALVVAFLVVIGAWVLGLIFSFPARWLHGRVSPIDSLALDIRTRRVPEGGPVDLKTVPLLLKDGGLLDQILAALPAALGDLVHSRVYSDPNAFVEIETWYRSRGDGFRTGSATRRP